MNAELITIVKEFATLMELAGENQFKTRAFSNAARILETEKIDVKAAVANGSLQRTKGIGAGIQAVITEYVETGDIAAYRELKAAIPPGLLEMAKIKGLGVKKILAVHGELGIATVGELEYACRENRLADLKGFGAKTQEKILSAIEQYNSSKYTYRVDKARVEAEELLAKARALDGVEQADISGAVRRACELVTDIYLVAQARDVTAALRQGAEALSATPTQTGNALEGSTPGGIPFIVEFTGSDAYYWRLHQTTGSTAYVEELARKLTSGDIIPGERGLYSNGQPLAVHGEADIFVAAKIHPIPPELREEPHIVKHAEERALPRLIEENDMRGMLHIHSNWSDGRDSLREMALGAKAMGYTYFAICDHSQSAVYANGLRPDRVQRQHEEIDELNAEDLGIRILKGIESDILPSGELDYDDAVLETFDVVVASVHSVFSMTREAMTDRIIKAVENPYTTILGHPTGRLLLARKGYDVDLEAVIDAAADHNTIIEINANPYRLDLDWRFVRSAKERGVEIAINPDAHRVEDLGLVRYGVGIARKGGLEAQDVVNTFSLERFLERIGKG